MLAFVHRSELVRLQREIRQARRRALLEGHTTSWFVCFRSQVRATPKRTPVRTTASRCSLPAESIATVRLFHAALTPPRALSGDASA